MREILFRGEDINGEVYFGMLFYTQYSTVKSIGLKPCIQVIKDDVYYSSFEVIPETVVQYTGVKDKNGVKLFDKDLVTSLNTGKLFEIVWYFNGWKMRVLEYNGIQGHQYADLYEGDLELYIPTEPIICVAI